MARRGLTPAAVRDAAVAVADADGLAAITIKRVADDLGVRPPSLYNHVASRDALVRAVAIRAAHELREVMAAAVLGRSGDDALRAAAHAYRDWGRAHPARAAATQRAPVPGDEEYVAAGRGIEEILYAALRERALDHDDEVHAVRAMRAAVLGFVSIEAASGFRNLVNVDRSFDVLISAIVGGLAPALQPEGGVADDG